MGIEGKNGGRQLGWARSGIVLTTGRQGAFSRGCIPGFLLARGVLVPEASACGERQHEGGSMVTGGRAGKGYSKVSEAAFLVW